MHKKGLSLLEIIVSTVILALVMTGLVNVFVAGKKYILHSRYRMAGGEVGKKFLDPLQQYVRQDTWSSNCFVANDPNNPANMSNCSAIPASYLIGGTTYTSSYYISTHSSDSNIKKVKAVINWAE